MGAIRSTAQLLSYELVFSSILLILIMFSGSFSLTFIVECQQAVWNIFPLLPIALMFLIAILAETNRPPFDLPEAESELVAGFMTEHGASIFVFFFLGEYSALILMSAFMSIFFLGGHHCPDLHKLIYEPFMYAYYNIYSWIYNVVNYDYAIDSYINNLRHYKDPDDIDWNHMDEHLYGIDGDLIDEINDGLIHIINLFRNNNDNFNIKNVNQEYFTQFTDKDTILNTLSILMDKVQGSYILGFKIIIVVFFYIWIRASFPRLRYDQLMSLCWKELLPLVFAYIIFTLCLFYTFDMMPFGTTF